jgi:hypothetical protein
MEIYSKAKTRETKQWVSGYYYEQEGKPFILHFNSLAGKQESHEIIGYTLCAYSNFTDMNGDKLYNDDKVLLGQEEYVVVFQQGKFRFFSQYLAIDICDIRTSDCKRIGNIHD